MNGMKHRLSTLAAVGALAAAVTVAYNLIPAAADNAPYGPETASPNFWENHLSWMNPDLMCIRSKPVPTPYTVQAPPADWSLFAVILRSGDGPSQNHVWFPAPGDVLTHHSGGVIEQAIVCKSPVVAPEPSPTPSESPTPEPTPEPTVTADPTPEPTTTVTVTASPDPQPTVTTTATATETVTASPDPQPTVTTTATATTTEQVPGPTVTVSTPPAVTPDPTHPGWVPVPDTPIAPPSTTATPEPTVPTDECALGDPSLSRMCETERDFPLPVETASSTQQPTAKQVVPGLPSTGANR